MRNSFFVIVSLALSSSSFAATILTCETKAGAAKAQSYVIEITDTTISTTLTSGVSRSNPQPVLWDRDDAGIYSYAGIEQSAPRDNERTVYAVRFDFNRGMKLDGVIRGSRFDMDILFSWESLYFDTSGAISEETYRCKKL